MIKRIIKETLWWLTAIICSIFILNLLTFTFYHPFHELKRTGGSTPGVMVPHQWGLYGTEGWAIHTIDSYGYPNPDLPRAQSYYCVTGTSHTEGFHVMNGERFCDILNKRMGDEHSLMFYNVAHSGYMFDDIVRHFSGLTGEFPDMDGVIMEITSTKYSPDVLYRAMSQNGFDNSSDTSEALLSNLTLRNKALITIKDYFPLLRLLSLQLETYNNKKTASDSTDTESTIQGTIDLKEYKAALEQVFDLIRSEYTGEIIIVYHPEMAINYDGSLYMPAFDSTPVFKEVCDEYRVGFIDMTTDFEEAYYVHHRAPYGFMNTALMSGHINKYGNALIADRLYSYLSDR